MKDINRVAIRYDIRAATCGMAGHDYNIATNH
jgi:hypothetical protein